MKEKDSPSKRSVPSPRVTSLREAMGQSRPSGFGDPYQAPKNVNVALKGGGKGSKGKGGKAGIKSKAGYDTKTRVSIGGRKK